MGDEVAKKPSDLSSEAYTLADTILAENREELSRADGKASTLLAAALIVVGVLLAGVLAGDWSPGKLVPWARVAWGIAAVLALGGISSLVAALMPRHVWRPNENGRVSYFGDVAEKGGVEEVCRELEAMAMAPASRTVDQLFVTSRILRSKYSCITWGILLLSTAVVLALFAVLVR